jgi:V/A-type H+-transporting ATPase subunit K
LNVLKKPMLILIMLLPLILMPVIGATVVFAFSFSPSAPAPQAQVTTSNPYDRLGIAIGAGIAVGLATLGAGLAISAAGTAAISALAEKPDTFFRSFLVVALAEALAIYGLIMGILLWIKL